MFKINSTLREILFFLMIIMLLVGEFHQFMWLTDKWDILTNIAKVGEVFSMFFTPVAFIVVFTTLFSNIKLNKKTFV